MKRKPLKKAPPKERNSIVVAMRNRGGSGAHGPSKKATRRKDKMAISAQLRNGEAFAA